MQLDIIKQKFKVFLDTNKNNLIFLFTLWFCIIFYHILYVNRFLPPTDGWFYVLTKQIEAGMVPYKDFHFCLPPMYLILHSLINHLFGDNFINMRIFGIFERCLLCGILFFTLKKITSNQIAFLSVITAFMLMSSITYDLISSPAQSSILISVLVLFLWCKYVEIKKNRLNYFLIFVIGFLCFISSQFKQTIGIILFGASAVLSLLICANRGKEKIISFLLFVSGFIIPFSIELFLLNKYGCLSDYINEIFLAASSSKGGILKMLAGLFLNNYNWGTIALISSILFICFYLFEIRKHTVKSKINIDTNFIEINTFTNIVLVIIAIFLASILGYQQIIRFSLMSSVGNLEHICASLAFVIVLLAGIKNLINYFQSDRIDNKILFMLIFCGISCANIIASGLSIFFDPNVIIIAIAFTFSQIFDFKVPFNSKKNIICSLICISIIFLCVLSKYLTPYLWWGWKSNPVKEARVKVDNIPNLKGFILSQREADLINDIYNLSKEKLTTQQDYIYTFPVLPLPYAITGNIPKKYSSFPHIDVYPDDKAIKEAKMILNNPPKILVFVDFQDIYYSMHEDYFRHNQKAGQREINKNINELIKNKKLNYKKYKEYKIDCKKFKDTYKGEMLYVYYR